MTEAGVVMAEAVAGFFADPEQADRDGVFFAGLTGFIATGCKL